MTAAQAWSPWFVGAWVLWATTFAVLEGLGLRHNNDPYPPLTHVIHRWVPAVVTMSGIAWLAWHFAETYGWLP